MFADIMAAVANAFAQPLSWFTKIMTALSAKDIYLGVIFLTLTAGFLLKPLRGSGSDRAKKPKNEEGDDE